MIGLVLSGCSTTGCFYNSADKQSGGPNGEFSWIRSILLPVAIVATAGAIYAIAKSDNGGGGGGYGWQPAVWRAPNGQYYCVNRATGEYIAAYNCG